MSKRICKWLLVLCMLLSMLPFPASATETALPKKILLIGNSYSIDAMRFLPKILIQEGITEFTMGYLYYPGCTLKMHLNYAQNDSTVYSYYKTTGASSWTKTSNSTLLTALVDEEWDEIYLQQGPIEAARPSAFTGHLENLVGYINEHKTNPAATFGFHMTWAYAARYATAGLYYSADFGSDFGADPVTMYNAISSTTQEKIVNSELPFDAGVVPCGTAIANAQSSYIGDATDRDGYHRSALGQLIAGYTWFCHLTGRTLDAVQIDVSSNTYDRISGTSSGTGALIDLSDEDREVIKEAVNNAIAHPYEITPSAHAAPASLKVLAIGNSYSQDDMTYLYQVAQAHGVQEIVLGNLYKGGCTLATHWSNAQNDTAAYKYYKNTDGTWTSTADTTMLTGLQDEDWDIITMQQASQYSGRSSTYSDLGNLITYVNANKTNPNAKLVWNMTQAYQNGYERTEFEEYYNNDQATMYADICAAVKSSVLIYPDIFRVIPTGTAIQNVRGSYIGDNLNRDGTHLNDLGRYIAACTWYMELTNSRPDTLLLDTMYSTLLSDTFTVSESDRSAIRSAIVSAIETPRKVSESEFDLPVVELEDLDVFFINGVAKPGAYNEVVVLHSEVLPAVGVMAKVLLPASSDAYNHSWNSELRSRFWHMQNGELKRAYGVWYSKPARGTFGYHEKFIAMDSEKMTIAHATGCTGSGKNCRYSFDQICEKNPRSEAYECGKLVKGSNPSVYTVTLADPVVVDLRSGVTNPVNSMEGLEALAQTGEVVMNLYCSNPHQLSAVLILDVIANFDVTVSQPEHGTVSVNPTVGHIGDTVTVTATPDAGYELYDITVDGQPISGNTFTITGSNTVSAVFDLPMENTANMRLGESLDFYMYVPAGGKTYTLDSVSVGSRVVTDAQMALDGENYKITVPVFAKEMANDVVAVLTDANGRLHAVGDSVKEYAGRILSTSESATEKTMMTDMLIYGAAAQTYFGYNTEALATAGVDLSAATPAIDLSTVYDQADTVHPMAYHSANLTLEERIDFAMYFWTTRIGEDKSYTYTVSNEAGTIANGNGTFSATLDGAEGYLYEVHISGLKLSAMSEAVIALTYHDKDGNTYTAKDSMPNYLYRNEGLAIGDTPQSYTLNADGSTLSEGAKAGTDTSALYAKIMAFAASSKQYAEEFDVPVGPVGPVEYTLVDGDVIFIPGKTKTNQESEGYILKSDTLAAGTKVVVTIPTGDTKYTDGTTHTSSTTNQSSGKFWMMSGEEIKLAQGVWDGTSSPRAYKFGYHDAISATTSTTMTLKHAVGHTGSGASCTYKFSPACGQTTNYRYRECARKQNVNASTLILDLRAAVLAGTEEAVTTVAQIKALTDAGTAVVNTYVPDGVSVGSSNSGTTTAGGTAAAIIVIDHTPA